MTNPTNKKTHKEFINEIPKALGIKILNKYINTDTKIKYKCKHGINFARPWQILIFKNCCRKGYYESGKMWEKRIVNSEKRLEWYKKQRPKLDFTDAVLVPNTRNKFYNIKCYLHPNVSFIGSSKKQHCTPCPKCKIENFKELMALRKGVFHSIHKITKVSKSEKKWLDKLGIPERQYWLPKVKYRVDGYNPATNTVYLYHGRFWHGCPKTFNPDMKHPVIKIPMKDLYKRTIYYEHKIKKAGYKLIVKWGT